MLHYQELIGMTQELGMVVGLSYQYLSVIGYKSCNVEGNYGYTNKGNAIIIGMEGK